MKPFRLNRRHLLRGLGSIGIGLPLLDVMEGSRVASAQSAAVAKRFIVMYEQTGYIYNQWKPTGSTGGVDAFQLSPTLAPLEKYKSKIVILDGLTNEAARHGIGDDHGKGMGTMLTGTELGGSTNQLTAGGISIDQAIANKIGTGTKFKSLEFGVQAGAGNITNYSSHAGAGQPLPMTDDPAAMYNRVFSSFTPPPTNGAPAAAGPDPALVRLMNERKSVLDAAMDSYTALLPKVSADDRIKLQAHLDRIRELENRLLVPPTSSTSSASSTSAGCAKPASPSISYKTNANFPAVGQLQMDLLAMAHACDLTRVSVLQFSRDSADPVYTWLNLGITRGHHSISHDSSSVAQSQTWLAAIDKWHAEQFAYLIGKLDSIAEGSGTMLDNSVVLWVNGLAAGNVHSHGPNPPQPIVMAGGGGGAIKGGRYMVVPKGANTNDVYVSCLNAFGDTATTFGNPAYCKGPLAGLLS